MLPKGVLQKTRATVPEPRTWPESRGEILKIEGSNWLQHPDSLTYVKTIDDTIIGTSKSDFANGTVTRYHTFGTNVNRLTIKLNY